MISHTIAPYKAPRETFQQQSKRFQGESGTDSHKLFIFERTIKNCKFKRGDYVIFKRNKYQILHVDDDVNDTVWDGLSACILTIWNGADDGEDSFLSVHPNQVKRDK